MEEPQRLKDRIEEQRKELEKAVVEEDFAVYYEKSLEMDKLIEQYLDLEKNSPLSTTGI